MSSITTLKGTSWWATTSGTGSLAPSGRRHPPPRFLELDQLGEDDVRHRPDLVEHRGGHGVVQVQDGHRAPASPLATELHAGDVDPVPAAERADAADHAGDIEVGEDEHPALGQRLDGKPVDPHEEIGRAHV